MRWLRAVGARLRVLWVWPLEHVRANIRNATALASSALRVLHRQRVAPPQPRSDRPGERTGQGGRGRYIQRSSVSLTAAACDRSDRLPSSAAQVFCQPVL